MGSFGDSDNSPTKTYLIEHHDTPLALKNFNYSFSKRLAEGLYDLNADPNELNNLASNKTIWQ